MPDELLEIFGLDPEQKTPLDIDLVAQLLMDLVPNFFSLDDPANGRRGVLNRTLLCNLTKICTYSFFEPGAFVCRASDEAKYYFLVLKGSVMIELVDGDTRTFFEGSGFHHRPLMAESDEYGYTAQCPSTGDGAALAMIPIRLETPQRVFPNEARLRDAVRHMVAKSLLLTGAVAIDGYPTVSVSSALHSSPRLVMAVLNAMPNL